MRRYEALWQRTVLKSLPPETQGPIVDSCFLFDSAQSLRRRNDMGVRRRNDVDGGVQKWWEAG